MKKVLSIKKLKKSFGYAFKEIDVVSNEPNMKIHVSVAILVIMAFLFKISMIEWII